MNPRIPAILDRVSSEDVVLDVGCVQHSAEEESDKNWLHKRLSDVCKEIVGIDVLKEDIRILQERGYDVEHQSAEEFELDRDFDVIVAGELIEHLANPGKFLDCARAHLKPDGRLLLTTPNPWAVSRFWHALRGDVPVNPEHTCWFDRKTIRELLSRRDFTVSEFEYIEPFWEKAISFQNRKVISPTRLFWSLGFNTLGAQNFLVVAQVKSP